ncbi:MAG: transcription antitermination factor NusB [Parvibaculaceae bacterium]
MNTRQNRRSGQAPAGTSARNAALRALFAVLEKGETLDEALARELASADLAVHPSDRAFARAIVTLVLRRLGQVDDLLASLLDRPLPARAGRAVNLLRIGAAELLFLGSAQHAAVNCAVDLAAADRNTRPYRGLINAVLRRITREGPALIEHQDAARLNTPDWAWKSWSGAYGAETARAIAEAHLAEPPLDISVRARPEDWAKKLSGALLPTGSIRLSHAGRIEDLPDFTEGGWWVQDAAAALPAKLLGEVSGTPVLDLCAAPGGKTLELAAAGASVTAVDRAGGRLERLRANLKRTRLNAEIVKADLLDWAPPQQFPKILLDAPCSATGTARRHPDVLRLKDTEEVASLAALQANLLARAASWLSPGGTLVYCTCSLEPLEGPAQIGLFLKNNPAFARVPIGAAEIGGLNECLTPEGDLRTLPCHMADTGGMDGFFAARLTRTD